AAPGNEVPDRLGDEDLARRGDLSEARAHLRDDADDLVTDDLALAHVHANSKWQTCSLHGVDDTERASHRASRPFEGSDEPGSGARELHSAEASDVIADHLVVDREELAPGRMLGAL